MALRPVRTLGEKVLRRKARDVEKIDALIQMLLNDMADTMYHNKGIGLAANQIGELKKLVVIDIGEGLIKLVNPRIIRREGNEVCTEACLSAPHMLGEVARPSSVTVKAVDEEGKNFQIEGTGLLARVLQHEIDHLSGRLFIDRAYNLRECKEAESEEASRAAS